MPLYFGEPLPAPYSKELGNRVRRARADVGMLLIEMAMSFGLKPSQLSGYETGRHPWPDDIKAKVEKWLDENHTGERD